MAKGQKRSNREKKKPKQQKPQTAAPASPYAIAQGKAGAPMPPRKK